MPGAQRQHGPGVIDTLRHAPFRFEFFQAVRILLAHGRKASKEAEDEGDLLNRRIRFRSSVSLGFPASEIEALEWEEAPAEPSTGGDRIGTVRLTPSLIGLTGPSGDLPRHLTQLLADRAVQHGDEASRDFLDIFASRAISLFFQAWLRARPCLHPEMDGMRRFSMPILSLVGIGLSGTQDRFLDDGQGVADVSLAYYAAAFRQRPRSVAWFARVVAHYFGTACRAEQFIGQSLLLPSPDRTRIGRHHCRLGVTALCGDQVWSREAGVRLTLGPMRQAAFDAFLPGGVAARRLRCLIRVFSGLSADVEIRLLLDRRDARPIRLGCAAPARLGWTAWIARDESRARPGALPDAGYRIASSSGAQTA